MSIKIRRQRISRLLSSISALLALAFLVSVPVANSDSPPNVSLSADIFEANGAAVTILNGRAFAAWTDNSSNLSGNPDAGRPDVAVASINVSSAGALATAATINATRRAGHQVIGGIAIDPTNPNTVVAVSTDGIDQFSVEGTRVLKSVSTDAGLTWQSSLIANLARDPRIAFDQFGNCFVAMTDNSLDPFSPKVKLLLSTDRAVTFSQIALIDAAFDVSLATGPGAVWLTYTHVASGSRRVAVTGIPVSTLGGIGQPLSRAVAIATLRPTIAVGNNGQVLVAYVTGSRDFPSTITVQLDQDGLGPAAFGDPLPVANVNRSIRVSVAFDRSNSAHGGRVYLSYDDGEIGSLGDTLLRFSDNGGANWSAAIPVSDGTTAGRFATELAVDPATGRVLVIWLDNRGRQPVFSDSRTFQIFGRAFTPPIATDLPGSPLNLKEAPVSSSRIDLQWTDTANNETVFQVERAIVEFEQFRLIGTTAANVTSFSDTELDGIPTDILIAYRVRAVNAAGVSTFSNRIFTTRPAPPPPPITAPSNLRAIPVSDRAIDLTWIDNSSNETLFEIEQSRDFLAFVRVGIVGANTTRFLATGLDPRTTYAFRVRAVNDQFQSPFSEIRSATTFSQPSPGGLVAPSNLNAFAVSNSQIQLRWRDNSNGEGGFEIQSSTDGRNFRRLATVGPNIVSFLASGLSPNQRVLYRVRAFNDTSFSGFSNVDGARTSKR